MKFKTIALCTVLAILTLTACGSDQESMSRKDRKAIAEIERQLDEIEKNNKRIDFMLCQLRLLDRVDLTRDDANEKMRAIVDDSKRDSIKSVCGLE